MQSAKLVTRLRSGMEYSALEHHEHVNDYPADLPFIITHGDKDGTVPFEATPPFAAALGPRAAFVRYPALGICVNGVWIGSVLKLTSGNLPPVTFSTKHCRKPVSPQLGTLRHVEG